MEHTFTAKIIENRRITIPKEICGVEGIRKGDYVQAKII